MTPSSVADLPRLIINQVTVRFEKVERRARRLPRLFLIYSVPRARAICVFLQLAPHDRVEERGGDISMLDLMRKRRTFSFREQLPLSFPDRMQTRAERFFFKRGSLCLTC